MFSDLPWPVKYLILIQLCVISLWKFMLIAISICHNIANSWTENLHISCKMKKGEVICEEHTVVLYKDAKFWGMKIHGALPPFLWGHRVCSSSHKNNFITKKGEITCDKISECNDIIFAILCGKTLLWFVSKPCMKTEHCKINLGLIYVQCSECNDIEKHWCL